MKLLKKSFSILVAALLIMAFALTATACKKDNTVYYEVSFVTNGGSEIDPQYVVEGGTATRPDDPTREGFTFKNWYDSTYTNVFDFETPITAKTTLYAMWSGGTQDPNDPGNTPTGETVTVTLNFSYDNKTESVKVAKGGTLPSTYATPTRTGYNFGGWYTDAACTVANAFSTSSAITADITLYAKWKQIGSAAVDGDGINWSNYWSGNSGSVGGTDGFTFNKTVNIGSVTGSTVTPGGSSSNSSDLYKITFVNNGGSEVDSQLLSAGETVVKPANPERAGYMFAGWKNGSNVYDFSSPVTGNLTLTAQWEALNSIIESVKVYNESLAVEFAETNAAGATVEYAKKGDTTYIAVDSELIRKLDNNSARVDILGLPAGEYNVKITTSGGTSVSLPAPVAVGAYDRSGYAHFNRKTTDAAYTGVGAYNDDGSLKSNALIVYVTDENKDKVMKDLVNSGKYSDLHMFQIPGSDWGNKDADGIGWWLNNNQYTSSNAGSKKNKVPSNTYDATNGKNLGFKSVDRPIVIRFLGTVTTPEGCTAYDDTKEGGGVGDNGHMARLKNLKNVTLEGVGEDAVIKGWGFHYVKGTDAADGEGTSFEVRNLTFSEYPEDAIGMEGQQSGSTITAGVERCWIHNCTFLPGYCANPAESDKAEGDGSCDFKRGQYYTLSYCYFEWCHKTNLIGSSDSSLQYNITMHHNMWYNCGSRIPLLRQSNLHFYNNYVMGDTLAKSPYSHILKADLSYVHSLRANCYLFSEANYYEGSKNVTDGKSGGDAKSWNDMYQACYGTDTMVKVKARDESVSSKCAYGTTNYQNFDTNSSLFYYDATNKVSDCLLDDALTARLKVLENVGANGFTPAGASNDIAQSKPAGAVQIDPTSQKLEINVAGIKSPTTQNNVVFNTKAGKGKGQLITFTLSATTEVRVTTTSSGDVAPDVYSTDGRVYAAAFTGTVTLILPAGTYVVASGQKDKESTITSLVFADTEASAEERINNAKQLLSALPEEISMNDVQKVTEAGNAYSALRADERSQVDASAVERYSKAVAALDKLKVEYAIARIDFIGTVTESSYIKINAAQSAYNDLDTTQRAQITNYSTLTAAWTAYDAFAVSNVIARIKDLPDLSKATVTTRETLERLNSWFNAVEGAFNELSSDEDDEGQQAQVKADDSGKTYKILTDGLATLSKMENAVNFTEALAEATANDGAAGAKLVGLYDLLTEAQKSALSDDDKEKFEGIKTAYETALSQLQDCTFDDSISNPIVTADRGPGKNVQYGDAKLTLNLNGQYYKRGMKVESGMVITVSLKTKMTVKFYVDGDGSFKYNSENVSTVNENGDKVITVTLEAGDHKIERVTGFKLVYMTFTPAA